MKVSRVAVIGLIILAATAGCTKVREAAFERGVDLFLANNLEEALKVLDASAKLSQENPDVHAWHAECLRRLKRLDEAAAAAYIALELDPHHAFAHTVLGDLFSPLYSSWERVNAESSWFYLHEAVKYDPGDGNAWSSLWVQAVIRHDEDVAHEAAVKMVDSGFLAGPALAYNRWQLEHLPQDAILLTNGDMDTYPSVSLQHKEGLRQDVAVVNLSLLNVPRYIERIAARYDIPLPVEQERLESLAPLRDEEGKMVRVSKQMVRGWMEMQQQGNLSRPLCAAVTVSDFDFTPDTMERRVFCGPYYEIKPDRAEADADIVRLEASLAAIDAAAFEGSFTSGVDRSPVRRTMTDLVGTNVTAGMLRYVRLLVEQERWEEAGRALAGAEEFDSGIMASGRFTGDINRLREEIAKHITLE